MNTIVQKSLTAGFVTALILSTGIFDIVLGVFVRTDINGAPTAACGYGFGYDSGYGYGYDTVPCPPSGGSTTPIPSGRGYVFVPIDTSGSTRNPSTTSPTNTNSNPTNPNTSNTSTGSKPTTPANPYGANYVNWDDDLSGQGGGNGGALDSGLSNSNNGSVGNNGMINNNPLVTTNQPTIPRRLPATGISQ